MLRQQHVQALPAVAGAAVVRRTLFSIYMRAHILPRFQLLTSSSNSRIPLWRSSSTCAGSTLGMLATPKPDPLCRGPGASCRALPAALKSMLEHAGSFQVLTRAKAASGCAGMEAGARAPRQHHRPLRAQDGPLLCAKLAPCMWVRTALFYVGCSACCHKHVPVLITSKRWWGSHLVTMPMLLSMLKCCSWQALP